MTTLLGVYNSDGCVGGCDAKCYEATTKRCHCICGGKNHGVGKQRAIENVMAKVGLTHNDLHNFALLNALECDELVVIDRIEVQDATWARELAYLRINQTELPFDPATGEPPDHWDERSAPESERSGHS